MKLLLIEDEPGLSQTITAYLEGGGYLCELAVDYSEGYSKIGVYSYDCVIVDITLPGGTGLNLIKKLKEEKPDTGIIIISAKNTLDDKILGLEIGADDYLTKPFNLSELNARIKSVLRRRKFKGSNTIGFEEIKVNTDANEVFVSNTIIELTKKEYELLLYFISNEGRLLTKESIAEHLWGDNMDMADSFDFIYAHIKNLRRKIVQNGGGDYIKTVYGAGYKFSKA